MKNIEQLSKATGDLAHDIEPIYSKALNQDISKKK